MLSEWVIWSPKVWSTQVVLKYNLEADKGRDLNSPIWEDVSSGGTCCPLTVPYPGMRVRTPICGLLPRAIGLEKSLLAETIQYMRVSETSYSLTSYDS